MLILSNVIPSWPLFRHRHHHRHHPRPHLRKCAVIECPVRATVLCEECEFNVYYCQGNDTSLAHHT